MVMSRMHISGFFFSFGFYVSGKKVGRTTELPKPEDVIEQLDIRTIAASPLEYNATQEDLENFFGQFSKVLIAPCHFMLVRNLGCSVLSWH
jgi:RNA recognition motif-containing protein